MNVFICANLFVCARNLATEKRKNNISQKGNSTDIIGIFNLGRNPSGTTEADMLTLITHKLLKLYPPVLYCKKSFSPRVFWDIGNSFVVSLANSRTQTGEKMKKQISQNKSSRYVQKPVEKLQTH